MFSPTFRQTATASTAPGRWLKKIVFLGLAALTLFQTQLRAANGTLLRDTVVDAQAMNFPAYSYGVPTVMGESFQQDGVVTANGWQYTTYYNSARHVCVGRRQLPTGSWQIIELTDYYFASNDSHNDVVLGICPTDGTIHLSYDHHNNDLHYRVSVTGVTTNPTGITWNASLFPTATTSALVPGTTVSLVTYPCFITAPSGHLLLTVRYGSSGGGDQTLYTYDGATHAWAKNGAFTIRTGAYTGKYTANGTDRNAYVDWTYFDPTGRLHMTWCWRETPDGRSNHDLLYAYSDDEGKTWKNGAGGLIATTGTTQIGIASTGILGWSIPEERGYINNSASCVDNQGIIHVMSWQLPDGAPDETGSFGQYASQCVFHHYWRGLDGVWHRSPTAFTGSRAKIVADDDGRCFLAYGDTQNVQVAMATAGTSWTDWAPLSLSGALPSGTGSNVNTIIDYGRWAVDRVLSVYVQEINPSVPLPGATPLHVLDYHVSRLAVLPTPASGSTSIGVYQSLSWTPGIEAVSNDIYFGTSSAAVRAATLTAPEYRGRASTAAYTPGTLNGQTAYFWRVDSVRADGSVVTGRVWSFTTPAYTCAVSNGAGTGTYGGNAVVQGTLASTGATSDAEIVLYYGTTDGGTNPASWNYGVSLGRLSAGALTAQLAGLTEGTTYYRFSATNTYGTSWATTTGSFIKTTDLATWQHTALLTVSGYTGTETLAGFPVLVRIGANISGFAYSQFLSTGSADLAFSDESGNQFLPYDIEQWNTAGTSSVWVQVPSFKAGTRIRMWWGRAGQSAPAASARAAAWSQGFAGVWHLDSGRGFTTDSSPSAVVGTGTALTAATTAVVAGATAFNGTSSALDLPNGSALNPSLITTEAWIKSTATVISAIIGKDNTTTTNRVWQFRTSAAGILQMIVFDTAGTATTVTGATKVTDGNFHHVAGVWDGATLKVYVDGAVDGSVACVGSLRTGQTNDAFIGRLETTSPSYWNGVLDEVRLSNVARSANWLLASAANQKAASTLLTYGSAATPDLDGDRLPDSWELAYFGSTAYSDGSGDADHNGMPDFVDFATGNKLVGAAGIPATVVAYDPATSSYVFSYNELAGGTGTVGIDYTASGVVYQVEASNDLVHWQSGTGVIGWTGTRTSVGNGYERVSTRLISPALQNGDTVFLRLKASVP